MEALTGEAPCQRLSRQGLDTFAREVATSSKVHFSFLTSSSVLFDAVYIPGGKASPF